MNGQSNNGFVTDTGVTVIAKKDEMANMIATCNEMIRLLEPLKPHKSAHSITGYRQMSGNFSIPKPVVAVISAAISEPDHRQPDNRMDEFLV